MIFMTSLIAEKGRPNHLEIDEATPSRRFEWSGTNSFDFETSQGEDRFKSIKPGSNSAICADESGSCGMVRKRKIAEAQEEGCSSKSAAALTSASSRSPFETSAQDELPPPTPRLPRISAVLDQVDSCFQLELAAATASPSADEVPSPQKSPQWPALAPFAPQLWPLQTTTPPPPKPCWRFGSDGAAFGDACAPSKRGPPFIGGT
jgi:hypothetical protein